MDGAVPFIAVERRNVHRVVASGFGVGLIPRRIWGSDEGAGTFGAALAALLSLAIWTLPWWMDALLFLAALGGSLWASRPFAADGDPGWIVIDEVAGTLVALIGLTGIAWMVALIVARAADITKLPPGVREAEALHGAIGITLDDVVAGLYGLGVGWLVAGFM